MRNRVLLALDILLIIAIGALAVRLHSTWTAPQHSATTAPPAAGSTAERPPTMAAVPAGSPPPLSTFTVVAERNLFNPERREAEPTPPPAAPSTPAPRPTGPKPRLYGVVLGTEGGARAFLEDPRTRRVFSYTVGDSVAESRVEEIKADRVLLRRGDETYEVMLRDPSKPKPKPPPQPATAQVPAQIRPGVPRAGAPAFAQPPGVPAVPGQDFGVARPQGVPSQPGAQVSPGGVGPPVYVPGQAFPGAPGQPAAPGQAATPVQPGEPVPSGVPPGS